MTVCRNSGFFIILLLVVVLGCKGNHDTVTTNPTTSLPVNTAPSQAPPLDHLAPGELQAGNNLAFGFPIPTTMTVERTFANAVHLVGEVEVPGLVRYVRANAQTHVLELKGNSMVFEAVRIPAAGPSRIFRIEITGQGRTTRLLIKDDTPLPPPTEPGLSDEERWRRAGMKPNGDPLDVTQLR
jgi:hypothetical protein